MYRGHVDLPRMAAISSPLALPRTAQGRRLRSCRPFWGPVVCPSRLAPRTRKLECTESAFPRRGLFRRKRRDRLSKKRLIRAQQVLTNLKVAGYTPFETEGVIERAARGCSATVPPWRPPLCQADRVRTTHFDSTHRAKAHRCRAALRCTKWWRSLARIPTEVSSLR